MTQGTQSRTGAVPRQRGSSERVTDPPSVRGAQPPLDGLGQVLALVRDGFRGLPGTLTSPRRRSLWVLWLIGIVGDAWTSHAMIAGGDFVEGNPLAAVGMGSVGMTGYLAVTTVICLTMAVVSTGRPSGPVARVAVGFLLLVCAGKVFTTFSNVLLWRASAG